MWSHSDPRFLLKHFNLEGSLPIPLLIFCYVGLKKKSLCKQKVVKVSMCQCACFYSAFEVSPHSLRLCLQGEKKKKRSKTSRRKYSNIYLCLRHRITFLFLLSREKPWRGSGQCFHYLLSFPESACIILHSCWADVKVGDGGVGLKIWHKSPGSLYAEDKRCKQTMISMSGRHLLWVRCLIIRHRTSFKGYFIIFNGRSFGKIINLIFGYAGSSLLYTGFFL